MSLRHVTATRFINSMTEGGSRPALVKADDGQHYVVKLRGAAQGVAPLAAEVIADGLARQLGLRVPAMVLVDIPSHFEVFQEDTELRELLRWSNGVNVGFEFIPEATMFDAASVGDFDRDLATAILWFDALILNVDRTPENPNLLQRGSALYLIDHGAAFYFHFNWAMFEGKSYSAFEQIRRHVLLPRLGSLPIASAHARRLLSREICSLVVEEVPEDLFSTTAGGPSVREQRKMYVRFLEERIEAAQVFEKEIVSAYEDSV